MQCVYAHGAYELKNRPVVNTVEYLKSKAKKPAVDNSKLCEDLTLTDADHDVGITELTKYMTLNPLYVLLIMLLNIVKFLFVRSVQFLSLICQKFLSSFPVNIYV